MDIIEILRTDYAQFPNNQTYSIYAEDVLFQDPVFRFRGRDRYQKMIQLIQTWFIQPYLDLQSLQQVGTEIHAQWILSWQAPLPWRPHLHIPGYTTLQLNPEGQIIAHIDTWHYSKWQVFQQLFRKTQPANR
jgi:hypothetical protein